MARLAVALRAEYRGMQPGGEFSDRETGETVEYSPKLKFENEGPDGDVSLLAFRLTDFDKCSPPFDASTLAKGDEVEMVCQIVIGERNGDRSYIRPLSVMPAAVASGR